jgi:hypothetical protein
MAVHQIHQHEDAQTMSCINSEDDQDRIQFL